MTIYFGFSDESGDYRLFKTGGFLRAHPYYIRATLYFEADSWRALEASVQAHRSQLQLPAGEIKWSYLWSLEKHRQKKEPIPKDRPYYFLRDIPAEALKEYIKRCISTVRFLPGSRVLFTLTDNSSCPRHTLQNILKWHLQEALQRIEMDLEAGPNNLCVLFVDRVSNERDLALLEAYAALYRSGDRYKTYAAIKDSLSFEQSHHSVGIQCSDFLSGSFGTMLRGFPFGTELYKEHVRHFIRRGPNARILGFGARQVPRGKDYESRLAALLNQHESGAAG